MTGSTVDAAGVVCALRIDIALPGNFRVPDVLAFHGRDGQQVAERVADAELQKGLSWQGRPACLHIRFAPGRAFAQLDVAAPDTVLLQGAQAEFERMVHRMLGLTQAVEAFESAFDKHHRLGPMIARQPGLRVPLAATPFEALVWAVAGQQISVTAALSLRRKMILAVGLVHAGSGLHCHPDAAALAVLDDAKLRSAGFSQAKTRTVLGLARAITAGELPLDAWVKLAGTPELPVADIRARLALLYGIGPWTIDYALLRGFGWLDGSLHGDVAVRRNLQLVLDRQDRVTEREAH
ncbi:MAG: AlkA N-terminal domain-containing protein, partial [Rubrivivax sp.]